jgi:hypothetical protein
MLAADAEKRGSRDRSPLLSAADRTPPLQSY